MPALFNVPVLGNTLHEVLTPAQFINLVRTNKEVIKKSEFIPPKLGTPGFGKFYVEYYYAPTSAKNSRH